MTSRMQSLVAALGAGTVLTLGTASGAMAQEAWPSRPIQLIVASSAGSGTDALARLMGQRLSDVLKQPVVVDARPGGSGIIAAKAVIKAPNDGYTLLYATASGHVIAPSVMKHYPLDLRKGLVPVAQTMEGGVILAVNAELPVHNLSELINFVKANPDKYSYATWANGSSANLTMEWLKKKTGMKTEHVAYKTSTQLLTDVSSGVVKIGWADPSVMTPFVRSGKVRPIAIPGNVRPPQFPEVQTMGEQGYGFDAVGWFGVFAPAGTDPAIVKRLHAEINKVQQSPEAAAMMKNMNFGPPPAKTTEQFRDIVDSDLNTWSKIAADAGIQLDL